MSLRPIRIATTAQLDQASRAAGFETFVIPEPSIPDFNRSIEQRMADGPGYLRFFEENDIDLLLDFNTGAMTFVREDGAASAASLTTAKLGIPYVALYLDPIVATMASVKWADHWHILENNTWIKGIWEVAHAEELTRLGVPNVLRIPMAANMEDFDTAPVFEPDPAPVVAFMGHPATTWFRSRTPLLPEQLYPGLLAAAVHADMPDLPFHKIYFDLYQLGQLPTAADPPAVRAQLTRSYFSAKFVFNAYLAVKQRDRWARFLKLKLGDNFELIGDQWNEIYSLPHSPRIWDMKELHRRMRQVPICLNLIKGSTETGLIVRHFEATAHGAFLLTYPTAELSRFFKIGEECDVFHNEHELLEKIAYYLAHPRERAEIARAGQQRTLREHLYSHRIASVVEFLRRANAFSSRLRVGPTSERTQMSGSYSVPEPIPCSPSVDSAPF